MNAIHVTLVVAFVTAFGTWFLYPEEKGSQVAPAAVAPAVGRAEQVNTLEKTLTQLTGDLATLKWEYAQLSRGLRAVEATANQAATFDGQAGTSSDAQEVHTNRQANNEAQLSRKERLAATLSELESRLSKELDDPNWSHKTEMEIFTLLQVDPLEGSLVQSAECHSTLCRVEIDHADTEAQREFVGQFSMEPPFDGEMLIQRLDDDLQSPRTLVYLARSGYPLFADAP